MNYIMRWILITFIITGLMLIVKAEDIKRVCITQRENESEDDMEQELEGDEEERGMSGRMFGGGMMNDNLRSHRRNSFASFRNDIFMDNTRRGDSRSGLRRRRPDDSLEQEMYDRILRVDDRPTLEISDNGLGLMVDDAFDMRMSPGGFRRGMTRSMLRQKRSVAFGDVSMSSRNSGTGFWHGHQGEEEEMEYEEDENEGEGWGMFGDSGHQRSSMMTGSLSCATTRKNIQVIRMIYGDATRGHCISQNPQCKEESDYDEDISSACNGQMRCMVQTRPRQLKACGQMSNYVGVEYRCVDEWSMFDVCQEKSQVVYEPSIYVASPSYARVERRPTMSSMCECILQPLNHTSLLLETLQTHLVGTKPNCTDENVLIEAKLQADQEPSTEIKVCGSERLTSKSLKGSTRVTFMSERIDISDGFIGKFSVPASARLSGLMVECGPVYMPGIKLPSKVRKHRPDILSSRPADFVGPQVDFIGKTMLPSRVSDRWGPNLQPKRNTKIDGSGFSSPGSRTSSTVMSPKSRWSNSIGQTDHGRRDPVTRNNRWRQHGLRNGRNKTNSRISQPFFNQVNQLPVDAAVRDSLMNVLMESTLPDLEPENLVPTLLTSDLNNQGLLPSLPLPDQLQRLSSSTVPNPRQNNLANPPTRVPQFPNSLPDVVPTNSTALRNRPISKAAVDSSKLQPVVDITPAAGLANNFIAQSKRPDEQEDKATGHTVGYVMGAVGLMIITMCTVIIFVMWRRREQRRSLRNVETGCRNSVIEVPPSVWSADEPIYNTVSDSDNASCVHMTIAEVANSTDPSIMEGYFVSGPHEIPSNPSTVDQTFEPQPDIEEKNCKIENQEEPFIYNGPPVSNVSKVVCSEPTPRGENHIYDNNIEQS